MKKMFFIILLFIIAINLNSRTTRTIIKECKGIYYEKVCYSLPEYYISDDSIKNSLSESLGMTNHDCNDNDSCWYLFMERDSLKENIYYVYLSSTRFGEKAICFFTLNGLKFFFLSKDIPYFLIPKNKKEMFLYIRKFSKNTNKFGEELEFEFFDEDDGTRSVLKLQKNKFSTIFEYE